MWFNRGNTYLNINTLKKYKEKYDKKYDKKTQKFSRGLIEKFCSHIFQKVPFVYYSCIA
jgi:hypothetical protein